MTESYVMYASFIESMRDLPAEDFQKIILIMSDYALYDIEPKEQSGIVKAIFTLIKPQLDANAKRREDSKKGGAPKGNQNAKKQPMVDSENNLDEKKQPNVNDNVNDNVNVCVTSNEVPPHTPEKIIDFPDASEKPPEKEPRAKPFKPPSVEEVAEYCKERKNTVDPSRFVDFYASKGWLVGKTKMKDWRASVRNWERSNYTASSPPKHRIANDYIPEDEANKYFRSM